MLGLVTPLNSSRALVDAPIAAKIQQVLLSVVALGVWQLPTRVVPTNTLPALKPVNVVPAGKVTSIVLTPVLESPPVGEVVKVAMYCVVADWEELPGVTARLVSALAGTTV